jgi:hypothetical protein
MLALPTLPTVGAIGDGCLQLEAQPLEHLYSRSSESKAVGHLHAVGA